ncbi:MAG: cbb3-type cytochrome c oxidase subunit 3 [Rhodothermales bacterium]|nr:cbb3-type cytochrome c oxidase subunit 3 [Rhodothermales bacterium]
MKEVVRALETGPLAEIGLVAFFVAFLGVVLYAFTLSKRKREEAKHLPLEDDAPIVPEDPSEPPRP